MRKGLFWFATGILGMLATTCFPQDTTYVYGGPGSFEGKFETAAGEPDRQGWVGVDLTQIIESHWHIDTYNCANLDTSQTDNHAWWCGEDIPSCGEDDPLGGYGNSYWEFIDYYAEVFDDQVSTTITIEAVLNYDNEPGYDFLYLECEFVIGMQVLRTFNGSGAAATVTEAIIFNPGDYVPHPDTGNPSCHLRWYGTSDGAWSDADCDWPSAGLAQIDNIVVSGNNGVQTVLETCEGPAIVWNIVYPYGVGDFSKVWPLLDDLDPAIQNGTPQFAFVDDGEVVPGTGGQWCQTWCYGPDGWCVTATGGMLYFGDKIHNEIWSPIISWPDTEHDLAILTYEAYRHNDPWDPPCVVDTWRIRSTPDPTAVSGWSDWMGEEGPPTTDPEYVRLEFNIADLLVMDCRYIQIALGAHDITPIIIWEHEPTPAPYLDNVSVFTVSGLSDLPERQTELWLSDPTPNPFNPSTTVEFFLPHNGRVTVAVYDLRGQLICILLDEQKQAGTHSVQWNGHGKNGEKAAAGTYLFRLETEGKTVTRKGVLVQ